MTCDIAVYDGRGLSEETDGKGYPVHLFAFSSQGYGFLVHTGLYQIPRILTPDGLRGIYLNEHRVQVAEALRKYKGIAGFDLPRPDELFAAISRHQFLVDLQIGYR
jgi:hypothetical protein